ncbi:MAG: prepilin-type N-terminal cleavage/methylation domain-containing protein [Candidatus Microsaccharimonas sp.]
MKHSGAGFTIVELLIVVVVIAILAAITIVSYNGITTQAYKTTVDSEVSAMAKQLELYAVKADSYPIGDTDLKPLVQQAGLWSATRTADWNYLYCTNEKTFALFPSNKKVDAQESPLPTGATLRVYTTEKGWDTITYDPNASPGDTTVANDLCATALPDRVWQRWFSSMP